MQYFWQFNYSSLSNAHDLFLRQTQQSDDHSEIYYSKYPSFPAHEPRIITVLKSSNENRLGAAAFGRDITQIPAK